MEKLARDDEGQLITRSQRGDVEAFNRLILHYQPIMYSTIFRLLGNYDSAADVTQDAFIAAFRAIRTYRGGSSFRAWLLRIGTNMACDYWRKVQRHPTSSLETLIENDEPHTTNMLGTLTNTNPEENPEEKILSQELQRLIQAGLMQLPLEQRNALILCDIQGSSYEEIAQITQTTLGTVRSRISRGRARLREFLQQHKELLPKDYRLTNSN
ncbi:MAG TPA: sigma-70 family RNA polymerase sigma factor [Dictyobacter sp.]|jgi:RNA polymerase sigma-70 factor (ECF subfamily)|nr:sigma-70 family RNA polymerase sigma factor [Dictyobacter sp.]